MSILQITLSRDRVECISSYLKEALENKEYHEFEIEITEFNMRIVPKVKETKIVLKTLP